MSDKVREELEATIKRGEQAKSTLAKLQALDIVAETNDLEAFKRAVPGHHTEWATDPNKAAWYEGMMKRVVDEAIQKLTGGGR